VEDVPLHRAQLEDLALARSETSQALHHDIEDAVRDRDAIDRGAEGPPSLGLLQHVLAREELQDLDHEEGIPLRLAVEKTREVLAPAVLG
jgi:hypothetical protein